MTSYKAVTKLPETRFSLIFLLVDGRIWIRTINYGSGSARPRIYEPYGSGSGTQIIMYNKQYNNILNASLNDIAKSLVPGGQGRIRFKDSFLASRRL
jgi:hypothetical protein